MSKFDQTYTDAEFRRRVMRADTEWMSKHARREPDLEVEGLRRGFLASVLSLFDKRPA